MITKELKGKLDIKATDEGRKMPYIKFGTCPECGQETETLVVPVTETVEVAG